MKIIEVSSEAGYKVGGIYTVLKSKTGEILKRFGDDYLLVGYYEPNSAKVELKEEVPDKKLKSVLDYLEKLGIKTYYGRWVKGNNARLLLLNPYNFLNKIEKGDKRINKIKYYLWEKYGVDSITSPYDFDKNIGWAWCAGMFLEKYAETENEKIIAHFHEWIAGAGILYLKEKKSKIKTVFTTHATTLGRSMASFYEDFTEKVLKGGKIDDAKAKELNVTSKHLMERACANNADLFTTVSDVTAKECEYILGKKPDMVTPNGVDFASFPKKSVWEEMQARRNLFKFLHSMFPESAIEKDAVLTYTSGRYEYTNKGLDLYLETLGRINKDLKKQVYGFVFVPTAIQGPKKAILENALIMDQVFDNIDRYLDLKKDEFLLKDIKRIKNQEEFLEGVFYDILKQIQDESIKKSEHYKHDLICKSFELFKNMKKVHGISAFEMEEEKDQIVKTAHNLGLNNEKDDNVKIIFYGTYVKPGDGLVNMSYYDTILGCDIGIFASRYEPWGYTPVEAGAMKNVAFTTDLAGFGMFIKNKFGNTSKRGIKVIDILKKDKKEVINQMVEYSKHSFENLKALKKDSYDMAKKDNWAEQIQFYLKAYERVLNGKK